jgi:hypothetical protein
MKTIRIQIGGLAALWLMSWGCSKDAGEWRHFHHPLPPFERIILNAVFNVVLVEADTFALEIIGPEDVIRHVEYAVEGNQLSLDNKSSELWLNPEVDPPLLRISCKALNFIHAEETCSIQTENTITNEYFGMTLGGKLNFADLEMDCLDFYYWSTSPTGGRIVLRGHTDVLQLYNSNLMAIDARDLSCDMATVVNDSKSDMHIQVHQKLLYSIGGTGHIYLYGDPAEIVVGEITSSGRLIR